MHFVCLSINIDYSKFQSRSVSYNVEQRTRPVKTGLWLLSPVWLACSRKNFVYSLQIPAHTDVRSDFSILHC